MTQIKSKNNAKQTPAATDARNFRTFLLVSQLEAQAIGARIAKARNEAGLTQEQLCDLATFSKRSLSDYENGVTIPYKHMREISRLLERPVEWFLHEQKEPGPDLQVRLQALEALLEESNENVNVSLEALREGIARIERLLESEGLQSRRDATR